MLAVLDAADKAASRLVFHAVVPSAVECVLSPVWVFHGCPVTALALCPWLLVAAAGGHMPTVFCTSGPAALGAGDSLWANCTAMILCCVLLLWAELVQTGETGALYMHKRKALMVVAIVATLLGTLAFDAAFGGTRLAVVSFYLCAWFCAEAIVVALKALAGRQRPGAALASELREVPRALPGLTHLDAKGSSAHESFPSGDAAGGAVFAASLVVSAGVAPAPACAYALVVSLGRMYLWAHHLGDVVAGCLIGAMSTVGLSAAFGVDSFGVGHLAAGVLLILPVYFSRYRLRRKNLKST